MLRAVAPRFRIAREGGIRRAATGYGSRLHLEKEQSAPRCSLPCDWGTAAWPAAWIAAAAAVSGTTTAPTHASGHCGGHPTHQRRTPAFSR
jgi:hypothetical protein